VYYEKNFLQIHLIWDESEEKFRLITSWASGKFLPDSDKALRICKFFRPYSYTDLKEEPLFLSPSPIDVVEQRAWLEERVKGISDRTIQELFPALQKLLRGS